MAHGNPIYYVCKQSKQYILTNRFSQPPTCKCGNKTEQISKSDLKELIKLPFMSELSTSFIFWTTYN
jgi:hypothetical protein